MTDSPTLDELRLYLPKYLTPARQDDLWNDLREFPNHRSIYSTRNIDPEIYQGDGWRGFVAIDFHSLEKKVVSGLVLSNSCDIASTNERALTPNVTFVPLVSLKGYMAVLEAAGKTEQQRRSRAESIKRQEVTSLMHLPEVKDLMQESVALFDDARAHPVDHFRASSRSMLFRLSDFGFYLFLFKLSIHFTRMMEGVER